MLQASAGPTTVRTPTESFTRVPATASELVDRLSGLPADDPRRARLRDEAIQAWMPLTRHLAKRYAGRGEPTDDLVQTATVGLIKAVDRFDAARGVDFSAFAIPTILGEVRRHFRDRTWSVRPPRRMQEMRLSITDAGNVLTHQLGRAPTVADLATHLGVTEEAVLEGMEAGRAYSATSLSTPIGTDGGTDLGDTLGGADRDLELAELRIALGPALAGLDERSQRILSLRFFGNLTQTEIAEQVGISQMHVSRLISRALVTLRRHLDEG